MEENQQEKATTSKVSTVENECVLYVWPGDWKMPSLDPECSLVICYLKFLGLNYKLVEVTSSWQLFKNEYPILEYQNKSYVGLDNIIKCLKKLKNIDSTLGDEYYADMLGCVNLFVEKFIPAFNLLCWMDEDNTYSVIRRAYGKYVYFPLSIIKLRSLSSRYENKIQLNYRPDLIQLDDIKLQIQSDANECLNVLAAKLNNNTFMFENRPTLIDAYLYAYLGMLKNTPFINSQLKSHLLASFNLSSLVDRIQREYFADQSKETTLKKQEKSANEAKKNPWSKFMSKLNPEDAEKRKQQLIAVSIASVAMLGYAIAIGLIKIDIINSKIEYIEIPD